MEDDDWVKFGFTIWACRSGNQKTHALDSYKMAWTNIYHSNDMLVNGRPIDFLNNPQYTCSKPVPWRPEAEARFSDLSNMDEQMHPLSTSSQGARLAIPVLQPASDHDDDARLAKTLKSASFTAVYNTNCLRIKDGLLPGYVCYVSESPKSRLRVIFPLVPQYRIEKEDNQPGTEYSAVEMDKADYDIIAKEDKLCLYLAKDQTKCTPGKARYFCGSWVSPSSSNSLIFLL